jgi:ATP-dependent Clp protease ATP-binding subunit ClpA
MSTVTLDALIGEVREGFEQAPALDRLTRAVDLSNQVAELGENLVGFYVDEARQAGATWNEIGERLGVSRQAVQKRFIPTADAKDRRGFWDRASSELRTAVEEGRRQAQARRKTYLGTEHLLLGIIEQPHDHASRALAGCGVDPVTLRGAIDGRVGTVTDDPLPDETPFTQLALNSLQHALREALRADASSIDTIHLALGLITVGQGVAHDVLVTLGVSYDRLRAAADANDQPQDGI